MTTLSRVSITAFGSSLYDTDRGTPYGRRRRWRDGAPFFSISWRSAGDRDASKISSPRQGDWA
ncbi:MAG: hypothetical protein EHM12_10090 [Dehalococcoidia bacterium]|nr:MAG: hypothetical protein EHM12_10090 [Dehalococcoidia bacterium]